MTEALVIGGGPAGLMAAEELARAGLRVTLAERMPTVGRKLLMAGKSGLNLTKDEGVEAFLAAYGSDAVRLDDALRAFGPAEAMEWARGLGQEVFTGSTGRVFPLSMKASPLLRAWIARLEGLGVSIRTRWDWRGWRDGDAIFATPEGEVTLPASVTVLALGGASWPRLGSDGGWARFLEPVAPFAPANCGFRVAWSPHMAALAGQPVKGAALQAGGLESRGEFVISATGMEGGAVYELSRPLREGAALRIDLAPDLAVAEVAERLAAQRRGESLPNRLRKALRFDPVKRALVQEVRPVPQDADALAARIKALPLAVEGPMPIERAISTAGGLRFDALDGFMLTDRPGIFAAGEMLDWEAPTGGYLLTACLATGRAAGRAAAQRARV